MLITCRRVSEVAIQQAREESWAEVLLTEDTACTQAQGCAGVMSGQCLSEALVEAGS